jgi:sugar transferase EpsL
MEYLPRMDKTIRSRHKVKPGITGWAQVNGRNALFWEEKFGMDLWYIAHRSFWLDLRILFLTMPMIFNKKGIDQDEFQTMEEFTGAGSSKPEAGRLKELEAGSTKLEARGWKEQEDVEGI